MRAVNFSIISRYVRWLFAVVIQSSDNCKNVCFVFFFSRKINTFYAPHQWKYLFFWSFLRLFFTKKKFFFANLGSKSLKKGAQLNRSRHTRIYVPPKAFTNTFPYRNPISIGDTDIMRNIRSESKNVTKRMILSFLSFTKWQLWQVIWHEKTRFLRKFGKFFSKMGKFERAGQQKRSIFWIF